MKLIISIIYIANFLLVQLPDYHNTEHVITIATYDEDITGNGSTEQISLKGILLSEEQSFYRDIWLEITTDDGLTWTISYLNGYDPTIEFITLHNKKGKSIFFSSKNEQKENTQLHSIINQKVVEETLPDPVYMAGAFNDNFTIQLSLHDQLDPHIFHITEKESYEHLYSNEGKLLKEVPIITGHDVTLIPTFISTSKHYGIKSVQEVYNEQTKKIVGSIETLWYFENNRWIKINEQWMSK